MKEIVSLVNTLTFLFYHLKYRKLKHIFDEEWLIFYRLEYII